MAIVDKPTLTTQAEIELDSKIYDALKPILNEAVSQGMETFLMSHVVHCCIDAMIAEVIIDQMNKNK